MLLERFDPFLAEFDRLTQRTFGTAGGVGLPMDVIRRGEELVVRVDLPGVPSDKIDLTVASFDDPSRFVPNHHFGAESMHRAWINTEGLPEQRTEDYQKLVDKWVDATGKFPG